MSNLVPIGSPETLPAAAPRRNGRLKYPWREIKPGEWFRFSSGVSPTSARVMATNMGNAMAMQFHVFSAAGDSLVCRRIDGLDTDQKFIRQPRDKFGQVILASAELHAPDEPVEPVGRGRVYGNGIKPELMAGEEYFTGDDKDEI